MKLTVAIPTYKRPAFLERCVETILAAADGFDVEILVMDDSVDETNSALYARWQAVQAVRIVRNTKNLGIDANICACIENARGDYVWLIGEDDLMRRHAVEKAWPLLDKGYPFVFANYSYITNDQRLVFRDRSVDISGDSMAFDSFYDDLLWSAGFIGGCIIHRSAFLKTRYREFIGTYYAHVAGIALASKGLTIGLIDEPQVGNRVGDASTFTWSSESFGVFQGWRRLLDRLKPAFGEQHHAHAYRTHRDAHGYLGWKFLITKRADGLLGWHHVRQLLPGETSASERARAMLTFALIPRPLARAIHGAYGRLRRQTLAPFSLK